MIQIIFFILTVILIESKVLQYKQKQFDLQLSGSGCTYTGIDKYSKESYVIYNNCSNNEFAWIQHSDYSYYLYNHNKKQFFHRNDELPVVKKDCKTFDLNITLDSRRNLLNKRYASVKIITDNLRLKTLNGDKELLKSSTINIVSMMKKIYSDFKSPDFPISIELDSISHLQQDKLYPWESVPGLSAEVVFLLVASWVKEQKLLEQYHSVILLTGTPLTGNVIGIASLSSFCKGGVAIVESLYNDILIAKTAAHELGHNLGIRHTNNYVVGTPLDSASKITPCIQQSTSVMSAMLQGSVYTWDQCSYEWFKLFNLGYPYNCNPSSCSYPRSYVDGCFFINRKNMWKYGY